MNDRLILVTNDDGIDSPGLVAAATAASAFGKVLVAAPKFQQTAMGRSYPKASEIGIIEEHLMHLPNGSRIPAYSITGSPAQVVSYAILELTDVMPSLCMSGINFGENLGTTLTGSGTVGAAIEAESYGVPGLAISRQVGSDETTESVDWSASIHFAEVFIGHVLENGFPEDAPILNINIPNTAVQTTNIRRTTHSHQPYFIFRKPSRQGMPLPTKLPVDIEVNREKLEPDSDIQAVIYDQVVSVTPLRWSFASDLPWPLPSVVLD